MDQSERQKKIELLNRIKQGIITKDELKADFVVATFLDLMKIASLPDEKLAGKIIVLREPMRSFFENLKQKNAKDEG